MPDGHFFSGLQPEPLMRFQTGRGIVLSAAKPQELGKALIVQKTKAPSSMIPVCFKVHLWLKKGFDFGINNGRQDCIGINNGRQDCKIGTA
jgi:hypothetical protein